jgi:hypothetical protein
VEFQVYISKMNGEERIWLIDSIEGRGEEGMRFGRWFGRSKWWGRQRGSDHGWPKAVPWLHEHNLLEVEEVVLGHMGQKEFWAGCRNYFQILKQGFQFEKIKRFKYFHTEFELDSR